MIWEALRIFRRGTRSSGDRVTKFTLICQMSPVAIQLILSLSQFRAIYDRKLRLFCFILASDHIS